MKWGALLWLLLFGGGGFLAIYGMGLHLSPDLSCYARGGCAWSSPVDASAGLVGGAAAIRAVTLAAVATLGALLYLRGGHTAALFGLAFCVLVPHFPGLAAGPDAVGSALAVGLYRTRLWPLAALGHLEAGLVCGVARLGQRFGLRPTLVGPAAGAGAIAALALIGVLTHQPWGELQTRYLLPGVALAVTS